MNDSPNSNLCFNLTSNLILHILHVTYALNLNLPIPPPAMKCGETTEQNIRRFGTAECDKDKGKWNRACQRRDITALKVGILVCFLATFS